MPRKNWLALGLALTLAGSLALGDLTWAQGWGGRPGPPCPATQGTPGQGPGRGPNYTNCPNYPVHRNCPRGQTNRKEPRGPRMSGPRPSAPPAPSQPGGAN